jgi:hypothetical protein
LLYSGSINGEPVWKSINDLVANAPEKYVSINQSEVGKFLGSDAVTQRLSEITGFAEDSTEIKNLLNGTTDPVTGFKTYGFWGSASETYALEPTNNNFRVIAPFAVEDSAYAVKEIPALLQRAANGVPTIVEGMDSQGLLTAFGEASAIQNGNSAFINFNKAISAASELNPDKIIPAMSAVEGAAYLDGIQSTLGKAGTAMAALAVLLISYRATTATMKGDTAEAERIVSVGVAGLGAGLAGYALSTEVAGIVVAGVNSFVGTLLATVGLGQRGLVKGARLKGPGSL